MELQGGRRGDELLIKLSEMSTVLTVGREISSNIETCRMLV